MWRTSGGSIALDIGRSIATCTAEVPTLRTKESLSKSIPESERQCRESDQAKCKTNQTALE